jgi:hypothetical protein
MTWHRHKLNIGQAHKWICSKAVLIMAAFREHITTGLVVGYLAVVASVISQWATAPFAPLTSIHLGFYLFCFGFMINF